MLNDIINLPHIATQENSCKSWIRLDFKCVCFSIYLNQVKMEI